MALGYKQRFRGSVQHTPEEEKEIEIKSLEEMQAHAPPLLEIEKLSPNLLNVSRDEKEGAPQRKDDDKWVLEDAARGDFGRLLTMSVKSVAGSIGKEVGDQALLLAVKQNNVKAARLLIESGFDMLATDENGMNSIRISAAHDDKDMLYLMMESFSSRLSKDLRPLLAMLRREGAEKYSVNVGIAALELTIQSGDLNFILTAVSHGVDVNVKAPSRRNYNPLLYACYKGDAQAIHRLIAHGADVNVFEDDGWSPLMFAALHPNPDELIPMLLKAGADINKRNVVGLTALDMAKHRHLVRAIENLEAAAATNGEDHEQL